MVYENHTSTSIRLVRGDVRDAPESFVVIGRNSTLKTHYEERTASKFEPLDNFFIDPHIQICRHEKLSVIRNTHRPKFAPKNPQKEAQELQLAVGIPMALEFAKAKRVAMVPLSFRQPKIVAKAMVRMIWDISVASFLNVDRSFEFMKPYQFTIYCDAPLDPLIDELENGHYASLKHGWHFYSDVYNDSRIRHRYFNNDRFKFFRLANGG